MPDAMVLPKTCSNEDCESTKLSWFAHNGTFAVGCDECSETVHIVDPELIAERLNLLDYPGN